MKDPVRCKSCGYVMSAGRLKDRCPACGVPAKMFEPYDDRVSEKRKRILELHVHPIVVHLPQAFSPFLVLLVLAIVVVPTPWRPLFLDTARVIATVLPFSVILAFVAGLIDGKLRFRKVTTPILITKIVLASGLFAVSTLGATLAVFTGLDGAALAAFAGSCLAGLGIAVALGYLGFPLIVAKFPG